MATFALKHLPVLAAIACAGCASASHTIDPSASSGPPPVEREFRGVWVAAVGNIDWPSRPGLPVDSQKTELIRLLDRTKELGLNAFILHVRPDKWGVHVFDFNEPTFRAFAGSVAPIKLRHFLMASGASNTRATIGPDAMNSVSPVKNGRSRWTA